MKKMFKRIALALIIGFSGLLLASDGAIGETPENQVFRQLTGEFSPGGTLTIRAYCNTEDVAVIRTLTDALVRYGMEAYWRIMAHAGTPCYDTRVHDISVISVQLAEKLWTFEMPGGARLEMWRFRDKGDQIGFTWLAINGEDA